MTRDPAHTKKNLDPSLQKGIDEGITYAKESLDRAKIQFEDIEKNCDDDDQEKCPFYKMFSYGSNDMRKKAKLIIKHKILPAYKSLFEFIYNGMHTLQFQGLCSMKLSRKTLQNLLKMKNK